MIDLLYKIPEKLADLFIRLREEKHRQDREAAHYFAELADTLDAMTEKLKRREVPHSEGHEFKTLLLAFEEKTATLSEKHGRAISPTELKDIAERAAMLDTAVFVYLPDVEKERDEWLRVMSRMIGDCRGIAAILERGA